MAFNHRYYDTNEDSAEDSVLRQFNKYLARESDEESAAENVVVKRDALWTTTEVLDCIRRVKMYKDVSKLDLAAEMLNCYRRLKHRG